MADHIIFWDNIEPPTETRFVASSSGEHRAEAFSWESTLSLPEDDFFRMKSEVVLPAPRQRIEDELAELASRVPNSAWNRLPHDLSDNIDAHIYGDPD